MSIQYSQRSTGRPDWARWGVPLVLGVGVLALFALPTLKVDSDWDESESAGFSEVRFVLNLTGYDWVLYVAAIGILAAIGSALLLQPDGPQPRRLIMGVGSLLGLTLPLFVYLADRDVSSFDETTRALGAGLIVYSIACIVAAVLGFVSGSRPQLLSAHPDAPTWMQSDR